MRRLRVLAVFVGLLVLVAGPAWSQYEGGKFIGSVLAGPNIKDLRGSFQDYGQNNFLVLDRPAHADYSVALEYTLVKWVGIELLGGVTFGDVDTPGLVGYEMDNWHLTANLVIHILPDRTISPYITGGAGGMWLVPQRGSAVVKATFNFGGGLDIFTGPNFALRLDARLYNYTFNVDDFAPITKSDLGLTVFDETQLDLHLKVGIRYKP